MATPASGPTGTTSSSSNNRWGGTGDAGSAFSGLSRGGNRGRSHGRGGGRGGSFNRESRPEPEPLSAKAKASQEKVKALPPKSSSPPAAPEPSEKPPSTPKLRGPSRRGSRAKPLSISTQISTTSLEGLPSPSPPSASRPSKSRRKRSQTVKGSQLKVQSPLPDDNSLRPGRPHLAPVPSSAPIKDAPPHLSTSSNNSNSHFDMKTNIDALVERVRAVAMADNRPSTPGSHIDWAGDDDDSLPDLDDWGITTSSALSTTAPTQTISPIIVDGLKPLPEPIAKPATQERIAAGDSSGVGVSAPVSLKDQVVDKIEDGKVADPTKSEGVFMPTRRDQSNGPPRHNGGRVHHTLPPRPATVANAAPATANRWAGGTSMRTSPFTKTAFSKEKDKDVNPDPESKVSPGEHSIVALQRGVSEGGGEIPNSQVNAIEEMVKEDRPPPLPASASAPDHLFDRIGNEEGLAASIHAPKGISDSTSAPANLPSYPNLPKGFRHDPSNYGRNSRPTSLNSHFRHPRPGNSSPRSDGQHMRNHSSPTASAGSPRTRPVITGDAISRLARTIAAAPKSASTSSSTNS